MKINSEEVAVTTNYTSWLSAARQAINEQRHLVSYTFSADNGAAYFNSISYATYKVLPGKHPEQE
ncbi:hypothetical protein [Arsukibacterium sp.]|uniref:hypothetical protein n=1 Tax=Arsukibacterium sp. TaxID=1977258 RepID=UPI001BD4C075|nr:hypothetical protein [Arsukibacterium sp.]